MRALIRRVTHASVKVSGEVVASIDYGLLVYLGIHANDLHEDVDWLVDKILNLRIFDDVDGRMNLSISEHESILLISQFTLLGNVKKGTRPSFNNAAKGEYAHFLFDSFFSKLSKKFCGMVEKGIFGAEMAILAEDRGPVTIWVDSLKRDY